MNNKRFRSLLLLCLCVKGTCGTKLPSQHAPDTKSANQQAVNSLFEASEYVQTESLLERWREKLPSTERKKLLPLLLRHLGSTKKLTLKNPERVIVSTTRKPGKVEGRDEVVVRQDVFTEGGRAAWALEQLLDCQLPIISGNLSAEDKQKQVRLAYEKVVETLLMPLAMLNAKERASLASSQTDKRTLAKLAKDTEVTVRRAAAANPRTTVHILFELLKDPDPQVQKAAEENLVRSRTAADD